MIIKFTEFCLETYEEYSEYVFFYCRGRGCSLHLENKLSLNTKVFEVKLNLTRD